MPRKTRKEKFAAEVHKQKKDTPEVKTLSSKKSVFSSTDNTREYFLGDLRKSLIVVLSIVVIEFALYILNMSGMLTNVNL